MHEHYEGFYSEALREDLVSDTRSPPPCYKVLVTVLYVGTGTEYDACALVFIFL